MCPLWLFETEVRGTADFRVSPRDLNEQSCHLRRMEGDAGGYVYHLQTKWSEINIPKLLMLTSAFYLMEEMVAHPLEVIRTKLQVDHKVPPTHWFINPLFLSHFLSTQWFLLSRKHPFEVSMMPDQPGFRCVSEFTNSGQVYTLHFGLVQLVLFLAIWLTSWGTNISKTNFKLSIIVPSQTKLMATKVNTSSPFIFG